MSHPSALVPPALLLALSLTLGAPAPAQAQFWWLDDNGGPAYIQNGFSRSQMMGYARASVAMDRGMSFEQAIAETDGINPTTYELIDKLVKHDPGMRQNAAIMKRRVSGE